MLRGKSASAVESVSGNPSDGPPPPLHRSGEARGGSAGSEGVDAEESWTRAGEHRNAGRGTMRRVAIAARAATGDARSERHLPRVLTRRPAGVNVG